jgi:hypothetical protein
MKNIYNLFCLLVVMVGLCFAAIAAPKPNPPVITPVENHFSKAAPVATVTDLTTNTFEAADRAASIWEVMISPPCQNSNVEISTLPFAVGLKGKTFLRATSDSTPPLLNGLAGPVARYDLAVKGWIPIDELAPVILASSKQRYFPSGSLARLSKPPGLFRSLISDLKFRPTARSGSFNYTLPN